MQSICLMRRELFFQQVTCSDYISLGALALYAMRTLSVPSSPYACSSTSTSLALSSFPSSLPPHLSVSPSLPCPVTPPSLPPSLSPSLRCCLPHQCGWCLSCHPHHTEHWSSSAPYTHPHHHAVSHPPSYHTFTSSHPHKCSAHDIPHSPPHSP